MEVTNKINFNLIYDVHITWVGDFMQDLWHLMGPSLSKTPMVQVLQVWKTSNPR